MHGGTQKVPAAQRGPDKVPGSHIPFLQEAPRRLVPRGVGYVLGPPCPSRREGRRGREVALCPQPRFKARGDDGRSAQKPVGTLKLPPFSKGPPEGKLPERTSLTCRVAAARRPRTRARARTECGPRGPRTPVCNPRVLSQQLRLQMQRRLPVLLSRRGPGGAGSTGLEARWQVRGHPAAAVTA